MTSLKYVYLDPKLQFVNRVICTFYSQVMQTVKPHILVVELCVDRASVMQMDEEAIMEEAKDFSYGE